MHLLLLLGLKILLILLLISTYFLFLVLMTSRVLFRMYVQHMNSDTTSKSTSLVYLSWWGAASERSPPHLFFKMPDGFTLHFQEIEQRNSKDCCLTLSKYIIFMLQVFCVVYMNLLLPKSRLLLLAAVCSHVSMALQQSCLESCFHILRVLTKLITFMIKLLFSTLHSIRSDEVERSSERHLPSAARNITRTSVSDVSNITFSVTSAPW